MRLFAQCPPTGSLFTSSLELGGVVGSVSAGVLADYFVSWVSGGGGGEIMRRKIVTKVTIFYSSN